MEKLQEFCRSDRLPAWFDTIGFRPPQIGVVDILPVLEPRPATDKIRGNHLGRKIATMIKVF